MGNLLKIHGNLCPGDKRKADCLMTILPSRFMFVKKKEKRCIMAHLAPARASPYALYYPVYIPEQYDVTT